MTLADFKPLAKRSLSSVVDAFDRLGLTPNQVSLVSFVFALAGSALFYFASDFGAYAYVGASILVAVSGILDVVDGELARKIGGGEGTRKGDFLDHTLDRYSDMSIIIGVAGGVGEWVVGVFALTGTFLTSYMGTQAQAVGAGRDYGGVLG
ncbi:MAG: CDP-alcohol phosphatidyltransferase family protein, partial [Halobacteria archaeon]|nr:CDP-alcohol phosphatidyltransferase family protein [Halobacteria archaeon]